MVASTDIKFYVHTNTNAPQLTNTFGCMIALLDACLINGFGSQVVTSLVASGTTVTATFGTAHNFMQYQVIKISGANQPEFNGEHRIINIPTTSSLTFDLAASPSVSTATGTINCALPALGWEKPFSSAGKAAYRSKNVLLPSRPFLRVVDEIDPVWTSTYAKYAKVGVVEDMSDIDTMMGIQAPFDTSNPNLNWVGSGSGATAINGWAKWYYAQQTLNGGQTDATTIPAGNREWMVIGNTDYFYVLPTPIQPTNDTQKNVLVYGFGQTQRFYDSDNGAVFLASTFRSVAANAMNFLGNYGGLGGSQALALIWKNIEANGPSNAWCDWLNGNASGGSSTFTNTTKIPVFPYVITEVVAPNNNNRKIARGVIPGIYALGSVQPFVNKQLLTEDNEILIAINYGYSSGSNGQLVFKVGNL